MPSCKMVQAAEDYRFDAKLYKACKSAVETVCKDVEAGEGRELECLVRYVNDMPAALCSHCTCMAEWLCPHHKHICDNVEGFGKL